jgi:hypothetical protein
MTKDSGVKRDWGNPLLPQKKRHEKTDHARATAETADSFLADLDEMLASEKPND